MNKQDLTEVEKLLAIPLNTDNVHPLMEQLSEVEAYFGRVSIQTRHYERILSEARAELLPSDGTVQEKEIILDSLTSELAEKFNYLKGLERRIDKRISLGQSYLKTMGEEIKRQLN